MKKPQVNLIHQAIKDIHRRQTGDYESLMRQVGMKHRVIKRNAAQSVFYQLAPIIPNITNIWSRGVGKTFEVIDFMELVRKHLPRSANNWIVPSYKKFRKEILPSFKASLEKHGYYEGLHYLIGQKPPRNWHWGTPYQGPDDYSNIIYWYDGTIWQIVSQDVVGSGRGLNIDTEIRDEALLLDKARMDETSSATLRGSNMDAFKGKQMLRHIATFSSMPITQGAKWLLGMEMMAREYPSKYAFTMFDVGVNLENLAPGYVTDAMKTATYRWVFEAEYLNIIPNAVLDAFYSLLKEETHGYYPQYGDYRKHDDCRYDYAPNNLRAGEPLILGVDWGARINYIVVCQLRDEGDAQYLRALKDFWSLGEDGEIQSDAVKKFADYYGPLSRKRIILFYDRTGNNKTGITVETRAEMMVSQLLKLGWSVENATHGGSNPLKSFVRLKFEQILKEDNRNLFRLRINMDDCRNLMVSMQNTQTKTLANGDITKDKKSERANSGVHPTVASDPGDAMDTIIVGLNDGHYFAEKSVVHFQSFGGR